MPQAGPMVATILVLRTCAGLVRVLFIIDLCLLRDAWSVQLDYAGYINA